MEEKKVPLLKENQKNSVIAVEDLSVSFFTKLGEVKVIDQLNYSIPKGKILGVVGESGCGKSVSAYTIMGLLQHPGKIVGGKIYFQNTDLTNLKEEEYENLRGHKMGMIFQEPMSALNPVLTIGQQMVEQMLRHLPMDLKEASDRSIELLQLVGIPSPQKRVMQYPHELSGGMKQRAMIAMALSCNPEFLIADEPTTALDVTIQAQILELIQSLQDKFQMTVQFITHDLGVISEISDEVLVMYAGRVVESGASEKIFARPLHPYTHGLLMSIPRYNKNKSKLYAIPGEVPSPLQLPPGCAFQNRCAFASSLCAERRPDLIEIEPGRKVACFHPMQ